VVAWKGGLPPSRRPGSASSLSVSAARRRPSSKTESQVMSAAVGFSLASRLRFHFETFSRRISPRQRLRTNLVEKPPEQRKLTRLLSRHFCALREGGMLTLTELSPARLQLACALKGTKGHLQGHQDRATWKGSLELSICLRGLAPTRGNPTTGQA
jgi:hypothetical protein